MPSDFFAQEMTMEPSRPMTKTRAMSPLAVRGLRAACLVVTLATAVSACSSKKGDTSSSGTSSASDVHCTVSGKCTSDSDCKDLLPTPSTCKPFFSIEGNGMECK